MAYAGTPTGLAHQAGASQPWKTVLAAIAILAIGLALVIAIMFINSRAVAPATDRGFDPIEAQRGAAALPGAAHTFVSEDRPGVGTSSAAFLKAAAAKARAMSGVPAAGGTSSYGTEAGRAAIVPAGVGTVDDSYNAIEKARDAAMRNGAPLGATSFDASQVDQSRGAHGPLK